MLNHSSVVVAGFCPAHPDYLAMPCHALEVAGTSPATTTIVI